MTPRRDRLRAFGALAVLLLSACGATAEGGDTTAVPPPAVIDVGVLPAPLPSTTSTAPASVTPTVDDTVAPTTSIFAAPGNRILMIGDSILASTSKRYSNDMCAALVPLGWEVEIAAEVSRGIDFGVDVMNARGDAGWDVGLVFLGTNYGNDEDAYLRLLNRVVVEFGDIPVVLVTVGEYRDELREVNRVIEGLTELYDNLSIVDWREITTVFPSLLNDDGIHPTPQGREVLAESVALHLGPAPAEPGRCLDSAFTDDSAGTIDGRPPSGSRSGSGSGSGSNATTTTVRQGATTSAPATSTTKPGVPTTTVAGGGGSSTTSTPGASPTSTTPTTGSTSPTATTSPDTTALPVTTPPATTPTVTTPPATSPDP